MSRYQLLECPEAEPAHRWQVILLRPARAIKKGSRQHHVISRHPDMNSATQAANRLNQEKP